MTNDQIIIIARESIRDAAANHGVSTKYVHDKEKELCHASKGMTTQLTTTAMNARLEAVKSMKAQGMTITDIALVFNRDPRTISDYLKKEPTLV